MSDEDLRERKACRLWHSWSAWSDPEKGIQRWGSVKEDVMIQSRKCLDCNKKELRKI